ncbi:MAG TPA: acid phosphatase [Caldimonas sp.]|nr:acid phosphatase [Caldimonas sp.]HEX4232957.1 acid phosphatase [Caldimonas sp.]
MKRVYPLPLVAVAVALASCGAPPAAPSGNRHALDAIDTVVVIYAENRAFDNLFGLYPGANGIPGVNPSAVGAYVPQVDRNGAPLVTLPPTWGGLTAPGQSVTVQQEETAGLPNRPFQVDGANALNGGGVAVPLDVATRDLVHRFYSNIMQINGGRNDGFAAWSDAGGLTMGYYDGSRMAMWSVARRYTLADNYFMGAFGGSFLNHQYLICACIPEVANADAATSPARELISQIQTDARGGFLRLTAADDAASSAFAGPPRYRLDSNLTPKDADGKFYAVNTMQPPFQPSGVAPALGGDPRYGDPAAATTLPAQTLVTIGDRLDAKGVSWAWYGGAWKAASAGTPAARAIIYKGTVQFQPHHQPFNYFAAFDPATRGAYRAAHLRDFDTEFLADAAAGRLPAVAFYKPQGNLNQHPGYANVSDGDAHIASVVAALEKSPQWPHMLVVVTYDENGGFWDHARVPKGDRWGPATRVPAIIVSPLARKGFVDKTPYDTGSILRFITRRWNLAPLPGVELRDRALAANGEAPMGDLTAALEAPQ